MLCLVAQSCPTFCDPKDCSPPGSSVPADSPGNDTGVDCHAHLQGIFSTQRSNQVLLHSRQILYCLSHQGSTQDEKYGGIVPRWRRYRWGGHFLHHKFIKRSFEFWATFKKQLLKAGEGHQAPRKATQSLQKEVGQNIKDKSRDRRFRDGDPSWGGTREGGEVSTQ